MRKGTTRILSIILAVVIFGGAFFLYRSGVFSKEEPEPAAMPVNASPGAGRGGFGGGPIPVEAVIIQASRAEEVINVNGSTVPNEEVTVTSEVPGKVTKILFKEGTVVRKGAVLVQLDIAELKAQRDRLLVDQQLKRKIAERLEGLYKREGVSLQELEIAKAEADRVDAELDLISVQLEKRTVKAPFDGLLGLRQVSEGTYVSPGTAIVNLVSVNPINVEFSVPERYGRVVNRGTKVDFLLDGSNDPLSATVVAKEANVDATTRTLKLKAEAPNPNGRILPGAFANVAVKLRNFEGAIMVPTQAILPELDGKKIFVYKGGKATPVNVETGIRREDLIQVTKGLTYGDTIIITGIMQIRPGAEVNVTKVN
ncbi:MAG: efflux RND transporter periplasmic adaptor subunit [Saprospiraceae bacterium]